LHVSIAASRVVSAPPARAFSFLSEIENHWPLASSLVSIDGVDGKSGHIVVHGPLGVKKRAHTRLTRVDEPAGIVEGVAEDDDGTLAAVTWRVAPAAEASRVALEVDLRRVAPLDRVLLLLGGRRWLRRCLRRTLDNLEETLQRR
jgi:uncharacterized protein YndB with AHSA1/START domain